MLVILAKSRGPMQSCTQRSERVQIPGTQEPSSNIQGIPSVKLELRFYNVFRVPGGVKFYLSF